MEMHWSCSPVSFTPPCEKRDGIFELMPTDVVGVLKRGMLTTSKDALKEIGDKLIVPTSIGLVVVAEVAWFVQHTRTNDAYNTNGSVDKHGIEICIESYRKYCWTETIHWFHILSQIGERYSLSQESMEDLRMASCNLFGRRRLGQHETPFPVVLSSSLEKRAIWIDVAYQKPTFSNIAPFVAYDAMQTLKPCQLVCFSCKKVCKHKCSKCRVTPYCSRACQKTDYKAHKKLCNTVQQGMTLQEVYGKNRGFKYSVPDNIDYYLIGFSNT